MSKEIHTHKVNTCNEQLRVVALDDAGSGGACHKYEIGWGGPEEMGTDQGNPCFLRFQDGPIAEVGTNGVTHEALLAIVIDRLQDFQRGPFACRENALALTKLEEAMHWLHHRTKLRVARGVEGTHTV